MAPLKRETRSIYLRSESTPVVHKETVFASLYKEVNISDI